MESFTKAARRARTEDEMIYSDFQGEKLSTLGFGAMRLPLIGEGPKVDEEQVARMVDCAIAEGLNYFDTAYPYHGGESERVMGRVLSAYPRESFYLADKYPGHQLAAKYDPAATFEEQLERCGVEYFDFYLMHNVYDKSMQTYLDPRWGIIDYFVEQKKRGRIRHLGFSAHGDLNCMRTFLDSCGQHMEFCQIQLNYLDWTLQNAKAKCALLAERGIPVWVMEPLRGGKLANPGAEAAAKLEAMRPGVGAPAWAFQWLQGLDNVKVILSGMSSLAQMQDNLKTFRERRPLEARESALLLEIAEGMKDSVPCTACRYCCDGCPQGIDIPSLLACYNDYRVAANFTISMAVEGLPEGKRPADCIGCGKCARSCPQGIDIPGALKDFAARLAEQPSWAEICRQRDEAQRRSRG